MKCFVPALTAAATIAIGLHAASAADISGAGATFPYPVYAKWAQAYKDHSGVELNYQSIGSGGGIKQITNRTVTFGASDRPLTGKELDEAGLTQWPQIMGGVVPAINVPDIGQAEIVLDGATLADIYLGNITSWDDEKIKELNPDLELPSTAIAPVYRSDGSGTNFLFTDYLTKVSDQFKTDIGSNTSVQWPMGIGAKGNEGVANLVKQTQGSIGYVEYAYVKQNKMPYARLVNQEGETVEPSSESFQAAAANADWSSEPGFGVILTNEPGAESWPITGASFILMPKQPEDPKAAKQALDFFVWAFEQGDEMADQLDYVPMPDKVVEQIKGSWKENIKTDAGDSIWTASN